MSNFSDRVKAKVTDNKPPRVSAKTEYTDADLKPDAAGKPTTVDMLCDESSLVCLVACNYAVSIYSKSVADNGKTYIVSDSVDPTSVQPPPPKPPGNAS